MARLLLPNLNQSLNKSRLSWWLVTPNTFGGGRFRDILGGNDAIIQNFNGTNNAIWKTTTVHQGGFGAMFFSGGANNPRVWAKTAQKINVGTGGCTIACWVSTTSSTDANDGICGIGGNGRCFIDYTSGLAHEFSVNIAAGNRTISQSGMVRRVWYHIVGTYSGSQIALYRNGVQVSTASISGALLANDFFAIGSNVATYNGNTELNGWVDDVSVWSRGLSDGEVKQLYFQSLSGYPQLLHNVSSVWNRSWHPFVTVTTSTGTATAVSSASATSIPQGLATAVSTATGDSVSKWTVTAVSTASGKTLSKWTITALSTANATNNSTATATAVSSATGDSVSKWTVTAVSSANATSLSTWTVTAVSTANATNNSTATATAVSTATGDSVSKWTVTAVSSAFATSYPTGMATAVSTANGKTISKWTVTAVSTANGIGAGSFLTVGTATADSNADAISLSKWTVTAVSTADGQGIIGVVTVGTATADSTANGISIAAWAVTGVSTASAEGEINAIMCLIAHVVSESILEAHLEEQSTLTATLHTDATLNARLSVCR